VNTVCDPIRADELEGLFAGCCEGAATRVALAVSGGSDSTALAALFADWLRRRGGDPAAHTVLTVDHRLRSESAAEAEAVARLAVGLGFRHATLVWDGPKPQTGLQAAAREARYRLMAGYARAQGISVLLTAHTLDDQAETLLMRLARGSGLDGLAGIAAELQLGTLRIARPLLAIPKARLRATLEQRAISWIEDPSNEQQAFERTRIRAARPSLDALGLTPGMLASSVARLQRARAALDRIVDDLCATPPQGLVAIDPCGVLTLDRHRLLQASEELALRVLLRCILAAGGSDEPVPLARLEALCEDLRRYNCSRRSSRTLARALVTATSNLVTVEREPGREPLPWLDLAGGDQITWDGRFVIRAARGLKESIQVRSVGAEGLADARRQGWSGKGSRALRLAPSLWSEGTLVAVPVLGLWASPGLERSISCVFRGLRGNLSGSPALREFGAL
jgi:tRNA(Ile)-lysidine synthase